MKLFRLILPILIIFLVLLFFYRRSDDVQMGKAFEKMIRSRDDTTKFTAIILSADLEENHVQDVILKRLPEAKDVERLAIMYSLYMHDANLEEEFVDSIPGDEQGIKKLLDVESPLGSYFRAPYLRIIKALGEISMHDDAALAKLKRIYVYSDGWQGDSMLEMIMNAERRRGNDTDLLLESLQQ